jgi:hypothetical protein
VFLLATFVFTCNFRFPLPQVCIDRHGGEGYEETTEQSLKETEVRYGREGMCHGCVNGRYESHFGYSALDKEEWVPGEGYEETTEQSLMETEVREGKLRNPNP